MVRNITVDDYFASLFLLAFRIPTT